MINLLGNNSIVYRKWVFGASVCDVTAFLVSKIAEKGGEGPHTEKNFTEVRITYTLYIPYYGTIISCALLAMVERKCIFLPSAPGSK